jgi:trehalose 6-phosphate phosphatase
MIRTSVPELLPPPPLTQLANAALFLDLDGTLAPFSPSPGAVGPDPARNALLARLGQRLQGRLAVISGRAIADVDRILDRSVVAVAGVHGLERRLACGSRVMPPAHPKVGTAHAALLEFAAATPGSLLENKGYSVALHYRGAPAAGPAAREFAHRLAAQTGLTLQEGSMVVELRTPGPDKGEAVRAFMAEKPFLDGHPVFIGDDLTDEHGFVAVAEMGGTAILVGPPRATGAAWRLDDVPAVLNWLKGSVH